MKKIFDIEPSLEKDLALYANMERVPQRYVIEKAIMSYLKAKGFKRPQNTEQNTIPKGQTTLQL